MTRLPFCGVVAGAFLLLTASTAAPDPISDLKLAVGPGPFIVDGGAIFFNRSNDMDFSLGSAELGLLGPVTGETFGNSLLNIPGLRACESNPTQCRSNSRLNLSWQMRGPADVDFQVPRNGEIRRDPDAPFDFTVHAEDVRIPGSFNRPLIAPFEFSGTVDGVKFVGTGAFELTGRIGLGNIFTADAVTFALGSSAPAPVVPEPSTLALVGAGIGLLCSRARKRQAGRLTGR
jgi:hypothetical protein